MEFLHVKDRPVPEIQYNKLFINNEWCDSDSDQTLTLYDPFSENEVGRVPDATPTDVNKAVRAARQAFHRDAPWRQTDASQRGRLLDKMADLIDRDSEQLTNLFISVSGTPKMFADCEDSVGVFRYYAGLADKVHGQTIPSDGPILSFTRIEPIGVCALITPWNHSCSQTSTVLAAALAAGNVVVIKPSEYDPFSVLHLAKSTKEAGFPDGVVNVITGGPNAGKALSSHMDIDKISLVGSTSTGAKIRSQAALSNHKQVHCELGGKSPLVIFDDCEDLQEAARVAHDNLFMNQGQICFGASRTYVHENVYDEFVKMSKKLAEKRVLGDPFHPDTEHGPMTHKGHFERVMDFIRIGKEEGANLVCGGERMGEKGYFIKPTVFSNVEDHMTIAREEIFGPVQSIFKFSTLDEVIDRANDSQYGLIAGIFTRDMEKAMKFMQCVRVGTLWINGFDESTAVQIPFGGYKQSGYGKNSGEMGIKEFVQVKSVNVKLGFKCS